MPGQAVITLNENQWTVSIASTYAELTTGLSGVASLAAGTGMLFVLGAKRQVTVDTSKMLFPLDIIFVSENTVIDVASNIQPGYLVTEETLCDMFLEINAGEAIGIEAGDAVSVEQLVTILDNISPIMSFAIPLAALGFVCVMAGGVMKLAGGSSSVVGTRELPSGHSPEKVTVKCPLCRKVVEIPSYDRISRSEALRQHIETEHSHHSMWLTTEQREELEKKYGAVAVRWAEEATRPGDVKAAERAAEYYYNKIRSYFGLGHLSPKPTEEQIMKLRETLGLPADVEEILKIHRETGYVQ